jgi:transposase-like protein
MAQQLQSKEIAEAIGVSPGTVYNWRRDGMPTSSVEAAREWRETHRPHKGRPTPPVQEVLQAPSFELAEGQSRDVARLQRSSGRSPARLKPG